MGAPMKSSGTANVNNHIKKIKFSNLVYIHTHIHTHSLMCVLYRRKMHRYMNPWSDRKDPHASNNIGNNIVLLLKAQKHHNQIKSEDIFTLEKISISYKRVQRKFTISNKGNIISSWLSTCSWESNWSEIRVANDVKHTHQHAITCWRNVAYGPNH